MSGILWRATGDFVVSRRIPWEVDEGLRTHIDRVVDALRSNDASAEIEVEADLESAHVTLAVMVAVDDGRDGEGIARGCIAAAIRECGGRHEGLLPLMDEARLEPSSGPFSGLRTPLWTYFSMTAERVVSD